MKKKFFCCLLAFFLLFSCKMGLEGNQGNGKNRQRSVNYRKDAPRHIDLPLLNGGSKRFDVVKGYYIVRTSKDFDKSKFIKLGARISGIMKADDGNIFWHLYKNDEFFIKKVLKLDGVISAEYDFAVQHINPPKDPLGSLKPKPDDGLGDIGNLLPKGLEDGNMDLDPRMKDANYSLQVTHALESYKKHKDVQFKKPVLLGLIDTGFNYCNEDFWFTNKNGKEESVSYFTKSAFLLDVGSREFVYNLAYPIDENDPMIPYAKEFIKNYKHSARFFEMPCSKVDPSTGMTGYSDPPNSLMFWNWDDGEHGTHCSGMMAAVGNNGKGVAGVSWKNTKIASYKCFGGPSGGGWEIYGALDDYASYIEAGLNHKLNDFYSPPYETLEKRDGTHTSQAEHPYTTEQEKFEPYIDQGVYPVNMSLGGPFPSQFAAIVISRCLKLGILPVVAMGNDGQRLPEFPASYEGVLAVGATDGRDRKKGFSCSGEWIDICAPGDGILSTGITPGENYPWAPHWLPEGSSKPWDQAEIGKAYKTMSGTSMATPFMTGVLGYLLSFEKARGKNPGWLKAIVQSTADPLEGQTQGMHHEDYGYGRVNVLKAADAVEDPTTSFTGTKFDYDTTKYVTVKLRNKRSKAPDSEGNEPKDVDLGLSGHTVIIYADDSGDPKGFSMTNNKGEASFFFLPKRSPGQGYIARVNVDGDCYEAKFEMKDEKQDVIIEYDSPVIYISTITPHRDIFDKYSPDGEYDTDVDTIISIYEDGKFDVPVERMDYYTLDTMAFNAKPGKTYFAEITCFADPSTGNYRTGIYGLRIGYESFTSNRIGNNDFLNPMIDDKDKRQPDTGRLVYELIHGMDCWEPNDDFEDARDRGDFIDFSKAVDLKSYIVCCLTHQSDGLDRDIFMFKVPYWEDEE